jgi:hypothetical protein
MPQIISAPFLELCNDRTTPTPLRLTGWMILWLTQKFAKASNIVQRGIQDKIWTDSEQTKIAILPLTAWEPTLTERRPGLIIKRQELKHVRLGIDNRSMGAMLGPTGYGTTQHMTTLQGSHTVFCIAGESGEAEQLGAEVGYELLKFAPLMRSLLDFVRIELVGIGELTKLEEASENFMVPVNLAYVFRAEWQISALDDPVLVGIKAVLQQ